LGGWFGEQTGHLDDRDSAFLKHWDTLLNKEEGDVFKFRNELWTMLSADREKLGRQILDDLADNRCFANLIIDPKETSVDREGEKINRFKYSFTRTERATVQSQSRNSFLTSQINIGDPIVVSDELGHFALANGFVTDLKPDTLSVSVDRRLHGARTKEPGFDATTNQTFTGIVEIPMGGIPWVSSQLGTQLETRVTYRVDKDEFKSGMAMARNNIIQLLTKNGDSKRRELIVRGREPIFKHARQGNQYLYFDKHQESLNIDQRAAVEKVLTGTPFEEV
jgi:DNA replication ATP-dependent helicase Dna2